MANSKREITICNAHKSSVSLNSKLGVQSKVFFKYLLHSNTGQHSCSRYTGKACNPTSQMISTTTQVLTSHSVGQQRRG